MTESETITLLERMRAVYPRRKDEDAYSQENKVRMWHEAYKDVPFNLVAGALDAYFADDESGYAPTSPGKLKKYFAQAAVNTGLLESAEEQWKIIRKFASRANYWAKDDFPKLPEIARGYVGRVGVLQSYGMKTNEQMDEIKPKFLEYYSNAVKPENIINYLPQNTVNQIEEK